MKFAVVILLAITTPLIIYAAFKVACPNAMSPIQWTRWQLLNERKGSGDADQTLHYLINTVPIDSIALQSPKFDHKVRYGIVLLVISATYEKAERIEIRNQWAAKSDSWLQRKGGSLVVFLVGRSSELDEEAATYGDLLQVDVNDTYRNLVYKIEVGFRWLREHVQSEFVAKIDSDTVVHIDRLYARLRRYEREERSEHWIGCSAIISAEPIRDRSSPWYISRSDYPEWIYPDFCSGPGYVMRRATFEIIVERMSQHKILEVEDVFFTGVVRNDLDIKLIGRGLVATPYTQHSDADSHGPILCILNTHHQLSRWSKSDKNLTAAWEKLKKPNCPRCKQFRKGKY